MKQVYRSSDELEAQMICNLLEQAGIEAHLSGEHLQGLGIANQPVQIFVQEEDFDRASRVVDSGDPEAGQAAAPGREFGPRIAADDERGSDSTSQRTYRNHERARETDWAGVLMGLVIGILLGAAGMFWAYNSPIEENGIDYDGDGRLDEQWTYVDDRIAKVEIDANLDGTIDSIAEYDHLGLIESGADDANFNGTFDTILHYEDGRLVRYEMDADENGFYEYSEEYFDNGDREIIYLNPATEKPFKIIRATPFGYKDAEVDLDGDGKMDILRKFDEQEEIIEESRLN